MQKNPIAQVNARYLAIKLRVLIISALSICTLPHAVAQPDRNLVVQAAASNTAKPISGQATTGQTTARVALVVGNAAYKDAPLLNPVNDARAVAVALQESGFTVILRENTDQRAMLLALREFGDKLRGGASNKAGTFNNASAVGLFYYAGHGMQIKGRNYLVPVGANVEREDEVAYSAVDAQAVLDKMEAAGNGANIMILDACRNNPFTRSARSGPTGLAQMDAPVGTLVAFATSPGAVASDGAGANGLYTQHLLTAMRQSGSKVEDVFKQVRANVRRDSQGKQVPWEATSMEGDFYFRGGASAATAAALDSSLAVENALWDAVKNSQLPIELRAYLNRFPAGRYSALARGRLAQMPGTALAQIQIQTQTQAPSAASAAVDSNDQAAVDQRTQELLDGLVVSAGSDPLAASAPATAPRPALASNKFGYTVGDRWRYQSIDRFKQEVTHNWDRHITSFDAQGNMVLNKGAVRWTADGVLLSTRDPNGDTLQWSGYRLFPATLKAGHSEKEKYSLDWKNTQGSGTEVREGDVQVVGLEKIKVPAGEFEAWKIEHTGFVNGKNTHGTSSYTLKYRDVHWYVPALRNFVAHEYERRDRNGKIDRYTRNELTSFSLSSADSLALR